MGALDGQVALVTGGGSGLGLAIVKRFVAEGARVGVLDRAADRLQQLHSEFGASVIVTPGDVTSLADNERAVTAVAETFGALDILVGNAGINDNRAALASMPADRVSPAFDELFGINVKGYLLGAKAALDSLQHSAGCIIFTASASSFHAGYGGALYVAAKHAVVGLTTQLAYELAPRVRVNAVAPGYMRTNLSGIAALGQGASKTAAVSVADKLPLRQEPVADDYAGLYVLLAARETAHVFTGTVLLADGGLSIWGPGQWTRR